MNERARELAERIGFLREECQRLDYELEEKWRDLENLEEELRAELRKVFGTE